MNEAEIAKALKAMAHPARLRILRALRGGALCAGKTNEAARVSQPNLSQHLKILREARLLNTAKIGTRHCHYLAFPELVDTLLDAFDDLDPGHDEVVKSPDEVCEEAKQRDEGMS